MKLDIQDLQGVISKLEGGDYMSYFFMPDFDKPSGGVGLTYDHVRVMNENGFKACVLHTKKGFVPEWLGKRREGVPVKYVEDNDIRLNMQDFFFIPEGSTDVMENLMKLNVPCKRVVFCQNWFYVLNTLLLGVYWNAFGIVDCMSVSQFQTEYLKAIMPFLKLKNVVGSFDT